MPIQKIVVPLQSRSENEREFLRPGRNGWEVKVLKKFIEKTERKVQASTEKL